MNRRKAILAGHDPDYEEPYNANIHSEGQDNDSRDKDNYQNSEHDGIDFVVPLKNEENKTDHSMESLSNLKIIEFDGKDDMTPTQ